MGKTIEMAAREWVREFNSYPIDMIEVLMGAQPESWIERTMPCKNDRVYVFHNGKYGEIVDIRDGMYLIETDNGESMELTENDFEVDREEGLPMWGTLWSFGDSLDTWWMDNEDGLRKMSECGFRVYEHEEWGYFFGIDGAGYDFYEAHWIPAYKVRGLHWHDEEKER